jgi:cytochrome b6-f complex iron-sulfur subunit
MADEQVSRRGFLGASAALGSSLGAGLLIGGGEAKGEDTPEIVALTLGDHKDLAPVGGSTTARMPDDVEIIVAHVEQDRFACCSVRCPHANCEVLYDPKSKRFVCPCHNSQFDLDGTVLKGPARRALRHYDSDAAVVVKEGPKG